MPQYRIRPLEKRDAAPLKELGRLTIRADGLATPITPPPKHFEQHSFVAEHQDGQAIAFAAVLFNPSQKWELRFAVHPDHRQHGLATRLARKAITVARRNGVERIVAKTTTSLPNSAATLEKLGFSKTKFYEHLEYSLELKSDKKKKR